MFSALALWQQTPKAEVLSTPQAPLRKQNGETTLSRTLRGGDDSLLITDQGTEVSNRLSLCLSHATRRSQDSISASPAYWLSEFRLRSTIRQISLHNPRHIFLYRDT